MFVVLSKPKSNNERGLAILCFYSRFLGVADATMTGGSTDHRNVINKYRLS